MRLGARQAPPLAGSGMDPMARVGGYDYTSGMSDNLSPARQQTADRVRRRTSPEVNRRIDTDIEKNIRYFATQSREAIDQRIRELDREWDIERTLETNAASLGLIGLSLGVLGKRTWLGLPGVVLGFLLMHAIQGWCPPVPIFRRAGVRTQQEIDREKYALKILRGDFDHLRAITPRSAPGGVGR